MTKNYVKPQHRMLCLSVVMKQKVLSLMTTASGKVDASVFAESRDVAFQTILKGAYPRWLQVRALAPLAALFTPAPTCVWHGGLSCRVLQCGGCHRCSIFAQHHHVFTCMYIPSIHPSMHACRHRWARSGYSTATSGGRIGVTCCWHSQCAGAGSAGAPFSDYVSSARWRRQRRRVRRGARRRRRSESNDERRQQR